MPIKILISFLVFYFVHPYSVYSLKKDSITQIVLSDTYSRKTDLGQSKLEPMEFPFFDVGVSKFYIEVMFQHDDSSSRSEFAVLEIKKKSLQQFRLRPIVMKKIRLYEQSNFIDSLDLPDSLFASGNFDVIVSLMQDSFHVNHVAKAPFQLLRNQVKTIQDEFYTIDTLKHSEDFDLSKTFVFKYDMKQIKKNIASLSPMTLGTNEQKVIQELALSDNLEILKRYFYNFWVNKNPSDPEQAWIDYAAILNDVAKKYGSATTPGYESDRGRIYIKYGAPDKIERVTTEKNALPYEVWFYYRSGNKTNIKFLFFQPGMLNSVMILLNSNVAEEMVNPYWKSMLFSDGGGGDNKLLHKVFEYFN